MFRMSPSTLRNGLKGPHSSFKGQTGLGYVNVLWINHKGAGIRSGSAFTMPKNQRGCDRGGAVFFLAGNHAVFDIAQNIFIQGRGK